MVAVPLLSAAFFRVALGLLGDRYGPKKIGTISMGVVVVALLGGWLGANSYGALLGVGVLLGVAGASFAIALPLASRHYPPRHQGLAMGVAGAGQLRHGPDHAGRTAAGRAVRLARGLRPGADPRGAGLGSPSPCWRRSRPRRRRPVTTKDLRTTVKERDAWRLCGLYAVTFGAFVGLASFLPIFFRDQYGISKVDAATIVAVGAALGSFLRPLGGYLADRVGGTTVLTAVYGVGAALLLFASALPALGAAAVAFCLVDGDLRDRQRRRLPARRPPLSREGRHRHRDRRRGRRARRLLPAHDPRHHPRRLRLLRAGDRRDRRRRGRRARRARSWCAGPGSPRPERGHENARDRRRDRRPGRGRSDPRAGRRTTTSRSCAPSRGSRTTASRSRRCSRAEPTRTA